MRISYRINWIFNDAVGIFLGIAAAAGILSLESQWLGQPGTVAGKAEGMVIALVGGLIAGSILAWFQWRILKRSYPALSWKRWWGNTVLAFMASWILAILPSVSYSADNPIQEIVTPLGIPVYTLIYGSIMFGAVMGALIGFAQWLELRRYRDDASEWIGMNVFGWSLGMFLLTLLGFIFYGQVSVLLLSGIIGALIAALCVAVITSVFFQRLESGK
ncbi:MAG: hypothetical protein KDD06_29335 [Phaeodactylibacter sp.]|nr:hypothetical protein [Phaeodactylibacter sp.]MCB9267724.1 hypothetical protein [Lewinellaceae bacterium]MCB9287461.1 hypothetical protein [Lewinellaceae bacterium]